MLLRMPAALGCSAWSNFAIPNQHAPFARAASQLAAAQSDALKRPLHALFCGTGVDGAAMASQSDDFSQFQRTSTTYGSFDCKLELAARKTLAFKQARLMSHHADSV